MSVTLQNGRLGNQIIRNLAVSFIAEKHNLFVDYCNYTLISQLGINLFIGKNKYENTIRLDDNNFFDILNSNKLTSNINPNPSFFQTKKITDFIHNYLNSDKICTQIINKNPFKDRYKNNNDCFIHIRLGHQAKWNPGFNYYDSILSKLKVNKIYISTDSIESNIIKELQNKYTNIQLLDSDLIKIFQFGSTSKYVILSYGTFSAIIGYLSYYSTVYYKKPEEKYCWDWNSKSECNMFLDHSTKISKWIQT